MRVDISHFLRATTRTVSTREFEGKPLRVLTAERSYPTDPADLWEAVTNPTRIERWFMPVSGDLRVGGNFQLEGNAGGKILACDAPHHFRVTWEFGGDVSWVEVNLAPIASGTKLTLEHSAPVTDERWMEYGPGAVGIGWELGLLGLDRHIETNEPVTREAGMLWIGSDEGKMFIRANSVLWRDASIASGTPVEEATAAAQRCSAAYTGEG